MARKFLVVFLFFVSTAYAAEPVPSVHSTVYEASHVITTNKTQGLYWITVTWSSQVVRWLVIYDSTTVPNDGALDATKILYCAVVSNATDLSIGTRSWDWTNHPLPHGSAGMVAFISVDAGGCPIKTIDGNNNWISAGVL